MREEAKSDRQTGMSENIEYRHTLYLVACLLEWRISPNRPRTRNFLRRSTIRTATFAPRRISPARKLAKACED